LGFAVLPPTTNPPSWPRGHWRKPTQKRGSAKRTQKNGWGGPNVKKKKEEGPPPGIKEDVLEDLGSKKEETQKQQQRIPRLAGGENKGVSKKTRNRRSKFRRGL